MLDSGMRLLFVNRITGGECLGRQPLGIMYLSSALKAAGHDVAVADACIEGEPERAARDFKPDAFLYSVRTGYHRFYTVINRRLKRLRPSALSVFGGPHATFYPEMIEKDDSIDAVCVGEGEEALCEFAARLERGADWENTPNFWARRGGKITKNPVKPLERTIEGILPPDRNLLAAYPGARRFPIRSFIASRGCPYDCTYCFNHAFFRIYEEAPRMRLTPVDMLLDEMEAELKSAPYDSVHFEDDIFGLSPKWLEEFAQKYPGRVGRPFLCNLRIELVTDRLADQLARAGCVGVWFGLESGDERVRVELLDRSNSDEMTRRGVAKLRAAGISICTENILGIPRTTLAEDLKTARLSASLRVDYANCSIFQPYPRTDLGKVAQDDGLFSGDFDELGDFYEGTSLKLPHRRELERLQELFAPASAVPGLVAALPALVRLPLHPLYRAANLAYKVFAFMRLYRVSMRPSQLLYLGQLLSAPLKPAGV